MNHSVKSSLLSLQNDIHVIFETVVLLSNIVSKTRRVGHKRCIGFPNKKANYGQQASIACQTRGQGGWSEANSYGGGIQGKVDIYPLLSENKSARATLSSWKVLPKWAQGHRWRFSSFDSECWLI